MEDVEQNAFEHEEDPIRFYARIPHLVDDLHLSPYAYRLYGHIRRVVGEIGMGECFQSTSTLAKYCDMSAGSVSKAKQELEKHGLIRVKLGKRKGTRYHLVTVVNIWRRNWEHMTGETRSQGESARSPDESARSQGETKKNPSKKNPVKKDTSSPEKTGEAALAEFGLDGKAYDAKYPKSNGRGLVAPSGDEPWLRWGGSKVRARSGIEANDLRRVGWLFETRLQCEPPVDGEWGGWLKGLETSYRVAGGDFGKIEAGLALIRTWDTKFWPAHPNGLPKAIRKAMSIAQDEHRAAVQHRAQQRRIERSPEMVTGRELMGG